MTRFQRAGERCGVTVAAIDAIAVGLPMLKPMKMAGVEIRSADNLLVRITGSDGQLGWGEAASAPTMTGELLEGMAAAVAYLTPHLVGRAVEDMTHDMARLDRLLHGNLAAKAAIDMALHDLLGKSLGVPVHALLGTLKRERLAALWLLGTGSAEGDVAEAQAKAADGIVAFKIKVGVGDPLADADRTRRVCAAIGAAIGAGALVCADANQGWDLAQATAYLRAVEGAGLDFLEQPVASGDLADMRALAASTAIAIGSDEGIHGIADIRRHHAAGAAAGCSLKTIKLGGLGAVIEAGRVCEQLGMKINLACKIAESSIATAAVLHLGAVLPSVDWGVSLSSQYLADDIVNAPLTVASGHARVPSGPGLGVDVDEAKVDRYRVGTAAKPNA